MRAIATGVGALLQAEIFISALFSSRTFYHVDKRALSIYGLRIEIILKGIEMSDREIIAACASIVAGHARCATLDRQFAGRAMSEKAAHEVHAIVTAGLNDMDFVEATPALSLAGCHAKASVIAVIGHEGIALSLGRDILANVSADGRVVNLAVAFAFGDIREGCG